MRHLPRIVGGALIVIGGVGSCGQAWRYFVRSKAAQAEGRAREFMGHLQHEDWPWLEKALEDGEAGVAELRRLRAGYGPLQSWSVFEWHGPPSSIGGGVVVQETRLGVARNFSMGVGPNDPQVSYYSETN